MPWGVCLPSISWRLVQALRRSSQKHVVGPFKLGIWSWEGIPTWERLAFIMINPLIEDYKRGKREGGRGLEKLGRKEREGLII